MRHPPNETADAPTSADPNYCVLEGTRAEHTGDDDGEQAVIVFLHGRRIGTVGVHGDFFSADAITGQLGLFNTVHAAAAAILQAVAR